MTKDEVQLKQNDFQRVCRKQIAAKRHKIAFYEAVNDVSICGAIAEVNSQVNNRLSVIFNFFVAPGSSVGLFSLTVI